MGRIVLAFGLLAGCLAGCHSFSQMGPPDPFVTHLIEEAGKKRDPKVKTADPLVALIQEEVPLQTPLAKARAIMERHGFACWSGVPSGNGTCLHCTAWQRRGGWYGDRVVVKLFYENRIVVRVEATVEENVWHGP